MHGQRSVLTSVRNKNAHVCTKEAFYPTVVNRSFYFCVVNFLVQNRAEMATFFREIVEEHKRTFDPSNIRDIVDSYLLEIETAKAEGRADTMFEGKDPGKTSFWHNTPFLLIHYSLGLLFQRGEPPWALWDSCILKTGGESFVRVQQHQAWVWKTWELSKSICTSWWSTSINFLPAYHVPIRHG